jgi:hypothetical protein
MRGDGPLRGALGGGLGEASFLGRCALRRRLRNILGHGDVSSSSEQERA